MDPNPQHKSPPRAREQQTLYAINTLFTMLEAAFPLKFKRAFPTDDSQIEAKKVWIQALQEFSPERIVRAGRKALDTTKFFPDLVEIRNLCKLQYHEMGLREPMQAYYEACHAPVQTLHYSWSHIAVYLAARETGWTVIRGEEQRVAFPIFERNYQILCNRVLDGEDLEASVLKAIEDNRSIDASRKADEWAEQALRAQMLAQGIDPNAGRDIFEKMKRSLLRK